MTKPLYSQSDVECMLRRHRPGVAALIAIAAIVAGFLGFIARLAGERSVEVMIAQMDSELFDWLVSAARFGGGFVSSIANAGLRADAVNYPLIRDVLLVMKQRYPEYGVRSAPEDLKAEAADLPTWSNE